MMLLLFVVLIAQITVAVCYHNNINSIANGIAQRVSRINAVKSIRRSNHHKTLPDLSQPQFPTPMDMYDLICVGSGPGGESLCIRAAQLGAKCAIIERKNAFGGPTGLTSKATRYAAKRIIESIDSIGGDRRKQVKGLWKRLFPMLKSQAEVLQAAESRDRLLRNGVDLFIGEAKLIPTNSNDGSTTVRVCRPSGCIEIDGKNTVIATGSSPLLPSTLANGSPIPYESGKIYSYVDAGNLASIPDSIAIIGGGIIAIEYASVLGHIGVGVSLVTPYHSILSSIDKELKHALVKRMRDNHVLFVDEGVKEIKYTEDDAGTGGTLRVVIDKNSTSSSVDRSLRVDRVLYCNGRSANSDSLDCELLGINRGRYGKILVDSKYRTSSSSNNIYAIGDVAGGALASTAVSAGRALAESLFTMQPLDSSNSKQQELAHDDNDVDSIFDNSMTVDAESAVASVMTSTPLTLWTIPEIASVGFTYDRAVAMYPYSEIIEGYSYYNQTARGRLSGDADGFLKVVAQKSSHTTGGAKIIGVHIFGDSANEMIQLGSIMIHTSATLEQVSHTPFAAVTMSALFQVACDDALLKLNRKK